MSRAEALLSTIEPTTSRVYKLWKRKKLTQPDEKPTSGDEIGVEILELVGKVVSEIVLGRPILYVDPKGDIYRTSKIQAVSSMDLEGHFRVETRNSEYILQV